VLIAEYAILLIVASGFVVLKSSTGTFPLLYSWYMSCVVLSYLIFLFLVTASRLGRITLARCLSDATLFFNVMIAIVFICTLVLSWTAIEGSTAAESNVFFVLLQSSLRTPENEYGLKVGALIGVSAVIMFCILFIASVTSFCRSELQNEKMTSFLTLCVEFCSGLSILSIFIQTTLSKFVEYVCKYSDGSACTLEYYQDRSRFQDFWDRYTVPFVYVIIFTLLELITIPLGKLSGGGFIGVIWFQKLKTLLCSRHSWQAARIALYWLFTAGVFCSSFSYFYYFNVAIGVILSTVSVLELLGNPKLPHLTTPSQENSHAVGIVKAANLIGTKQQFKHNIRTKFKRL
jgi:hypothetical protein